MIFDYSLDDYLELRRALTPQELAIAEGLVWELMDEWMYRWHRTWERGLVSEILVFAGNLKSLGEERSVSLLILFGRELEKAIRDFDILLIDKYMKSYPDMIRILGGKHDHA
ncbi:MAG: hypothetical protein JEY99_17010 [Spirochaetales bacterium]|nr:hypothetical protein [Spirochaetales bacterium]